MSDERADQLAGTILELEAERRSVDHGPTVADEALPGVGDAQVSQKRPGRQGDVRDHRLLAALDNLESGTLGTLSPIRVRCISSGAIVFINSASAFLVFGAADGVVGRSLPAHSRHGVGERAVRDGDAVRSGVQRADAVPRGWVRGS
jgi:hypothetical protein